MKTQKDEILIIGLGNSLISDDGLGIKAIKELKEKEWNSQVSLLEVGTSAINYLEEIGNSKKVIAIDAINGGKKAGSIYRLRIDDLKESPQETNGHSYSIPELIQLSRELTNLPNEFILYGIEPHNLELGTELSQPVKKALPKLIEKIEVALY